VPHTHAMNTRIAGPGRLAALLSAALTAGVLAEPPPFSPEAAVGKSLFFDTNLSEPIGISCGGCHLPSAGFTFPNPQTNANIGVAPGAVPGRFGFRAVPQISYAAFIPEGSPRFSTVFSLYIAGQFWDGHASGLEDQVHFPLLSPNEMNNRSANGPDPAKVVQKVSAAPYAAAFQGAFGDDIFEQPPEDVMNAIATAVAAYERSDEVSPFSSRYDAWQAGKVEFTDSELNGLRLITGTWTGRPDGAIFPRFAHCVECHAIQSVPSGGPDLFTLTCYQNIGVPRNLTNPFYMQTDAVTNPDGYNPLGQSFVDYGLGVTLYENLGLPAGNVGPGSTGTGDFLGINGSFKAPSLRNIDKRPSPDFVKAYMHNGALKSVEEVVHFYNTRNLTTHPGEVINFERADPYAGLVGTPLWGTPEYPNPETLLNTTGDLGTLPGMGRDGESTAQVGNLGLTPEEEGDIVAFLRTLSDGYFDPFAEPPCTQMKAQPRSQIVCRSGLARFTCAARDTQVQSYQWRHNGEPIPGEDLSFFDINVASQSDAGEYDCVITTSCGTQIVSRTATLLVCAADFNCDGAMDDADFDEFVDSFQDGSPDADINEDGFLTFEDFDAFVEAYQAGC